MSQAGLKAFFQMEVRSAPRDALVCPSAKITSTTTAVPTQTSCGVLYERNFKLHLCLSNMRGEQPNGPYRKCSLYSLFEDPNIFTRNSQR